MNPFSFFFDLFSGESPYHYGTAFGAILVLCFVRFLNFVYCTLYSLHAVDVLLSFLPQLPRPFTQGSGWPTHDVW